MGRRGGYRPNAGRKKGTKAPHTLLALKMRERLVEVLNEEFVPQLKAQLNLAKGIHVVMRKNKKGEWKQVTDAKEVERLLNSDGEGDNYYKIWLRSPSAEAFKYLADQGLGKAKETIDANVNGDITVEIITYGSKDKTSS